MLLRSVMKHVKDQNWFAVGIDFLIVVVGVFIGIQVANWNTDLAEQARGEKIKIRLATEFIEIESELARHVRDVTKWIKIADQLTEDILSDRIERDTKELSDRLHSIRWRPTSGGSNTITEIISQGDMDVLHSPDLVEKLLRFNTLSERHTENNFAERIFVSGDRNSVYKISYLAAIPLNERPDDFSQKLEQMIAAPDFYLSIETFSQALQIDLIWYQASLEQACTILQELNQPCRESGITSVDK